MALNCKREAFKPADGCPSISADLSFPDFESCEEADPGKLRPPARLSLQKAPAFPMTIPANDPLPISIPDIDIDDYGCPFGDISENSSVRVFDQDGHELDGGGGHVDVRTSSGSNVCSLDGIDITITVPQSNAFASVVVGADGVSYVTFPALSSTFVF